LGVTQTTMSPNMGWLSMWLHGFAPSRKCSIQASESECSKRSSMCGCAHCAWPAMSAAGYGRVLGAAAQRSRQRSEACATPAHTGHGPSMTDGLIDGQSRRRSPRRSATRRAHTRQAAFEIRTP